MSISYQLHSRNDLREWNAMFRKGGTSVKIDPHFLSNSDQFILSHDKPLPFHHHHQYSTLDNVLDYLQAAPACLHGRSIDIALCFKSAPQLLCDRKHQNSTLVHQWMSMTESFFERAKEVLRSIKETMDITVTFVLDGDGKPCNCLADKFLPWNSTWIDRDPCSMECYHRNDGFCKRYTILNDPTNSNWAGMAARDNHYGKFGAMNHPLQVWEPDSQLEILNLVQGYLQAQAKGVPSGTGLAFAINIDHSMFDIFTAKSLPGATAKGFSLLIDDDEHRNATMPSLIYQSPNKMSLQYCVIQRNSTRNIRTRQLTFQPFSHIDVGPAISEAKSLDYLVNEDIDTVRKAIIKNFGQGRESSQVSTKSVGNFSFVFTAVAGKVYASVKRNRDEYSAFREIGLGRNVHVSSLNSTLLVVTEGNHCYNSHIHNTRSGPLVCHPKKQAKDACPYSLDYSVGTVENWYYWLQRNQTVITPCNEHILHGTFSAGKNPSGALFPLTAKEENNGKIGIMVAHEPYPLQAESKCGTPITGESGIVISSFASQIVYERMERIQLQTPHSRDAYKLRVGFVGAILLLPACWALRRRRERLACSYYRYEGLA